MTPELNDRANALLNAIADEMRAQGRNVEVRHKVGEEGEGMYGKIHYGTRQYPCLFLDNVSCEVTFREQSSGAYYGSRRTGLLQVELEGVRSQKNYTSLKTTRHWKETKDKEGKYKPMDAKKIAEAVMIYAGTRAGEKARFDREMAKSHSFQDMARSMSVDLPAGVSVKGTANGLDLDFRTTDGDKMAKVLEAIKAALA